MKTSKAGKKFIQQFEGLRLEAYLCPAGKWTIGYGNTQINGRSVKPGEVIIEDEAETLFDLNLRPYENIVLKEIKVALTQNQFDALVSHTYNTGGSETLFNLINSKATPQEIRQWMENSHITGNKIVLNGLIRRRKAEADLYFSSANN